jgi:hypothetical protein
LICLSATKLKGVIMSYMSELDLSIRELIFDGTLEENMKQNVGKKITIRGRDYIVSEKDIRDYYNQDE